MDQVVLVLCLLNCIARISQAIILFFFTFFFLSFRFIFRFGQGPAGQRCGVVWWTPLGEIFGIDPNFLTFFQSIHSSCHELSNRWDIPARVGHGRTPSDVFGFDRIKHCTLLSPRLWKYYWSKVGSREVFFWVGYIRVIQIWYVISYKYRLSSKDVENNEPSISVYLMLRLNVGGGGSGQDQWKKFP